MFSEDWNGDFINKQNKKQQPLTKKMTQVLYSALQKVNDVVFCFLFLRLRNAF